MVASQNLPSRPCRGLEVYLSMRQPGFFAERSLYKKLASYSNTVDTPGQVTLVSPQQLNTGVTTLSALSACGVCTNILGGVIYGAAHSSCWLGCRAFGAAVGVACDAAFGGPEDPVADAVCVIAGRTATRICNQVGCRHLEDWGGARDAARRICSSVHIC